MNFSIKEREAEIQVLMQERFDVIIIGGGITGAGIALDGTTRGLNTVLFEMQDFAAGTSSRSTKLIHGGLRYLKQFDIRLVAEVGREREIVYENGPHVTTPEWMLLPIYENGTFGRFSTSIGLRVYDFLAGVKKTERRSMLTAEETLAKEPLLKKVGLVGGGYYVEYRTDDARLTIEVLKRAAELGAKAFNYFMVESFVYANGQIIGVMVKDLLSDRVFKVCARKVINAAGPWVDTLREKDKSKIGKSLKLSKGVHIVIDQKKFPLKQAVYYDTPDGRMVFAIPRDGKTYVGTTDTFYDHDIASPRMTITDQSYLLTTVDYMFPGLDLTIDDVESSWAGVRPLIYEEGKDPSEISRRDEIWQSPTGLITIAGGKLTGYRKMAEMTMDLVTDLLNQEGVKITKGCQTRHMPISGGAVGGSIGFKELIEREVETLENMGLSSAVSERLVHMYGSNITKIKEYLQVYPALALSLPLEIYCSLQYAIDHEMVVKPVDYFIRRTGALYFNLRWVMEWKEQVISYMAQHLKWTEEIRWEYERELDQAISAVKAITQE